MEIKIRGISKATISKIDEKAKELGLYGHSTWCFDLKNNANINDNIEKSCTKSLRIWHFMHV